MERLHQMTSTKKSGINKFPHQHVRITWWDIQQSNEAWIDEENILKNDIAVCSRYWLCF
jgi:hypothetical protein